MTQFSYQLYSSRNFPPLSSTFKMLGEMGYAQVEGYGALYADLHDLGGLRADLDANGLSMPTAHVGLEMMQDEPKRVLEIAKVLGIEAIFVPYLSEQQRPTDAVGWSTFGAVLAEAGKPFVDAGLNVGWHNHDFEFAPLGGVDLPLDLILNADPSLTLEFDVAWAVKGGENPLRWIETYGNRILSAHIKDIAPEGDATDEDGWADVGHGTMDWAGLLRGLRGTACKWFIMEHDNPSDHERFARRSLASIQSYQ